MYFSWCVFTACVLHQSFCRDEVDGFHCDCLPGFEGLTCETNIDECASSPCIHGTCEDKVNMFNCLCEEGYTGLNCEREIDECISSPCLNEGVIRFLLSFLPSIMNMTSNKLTCNVE